MMEFTIIEAIEAGGNMGLLLMGLALMRLHVRVAKIELLQELRHEKRQEKEETGHGN
jgi:hypothetical protein